MCADFDSDSRTHHAGIDNQAMDGNPEGTVHPVTHFHTSLNPTQGHDEGVDQVKHLPYFTLKAAPEISLVWNSIFWAKTELDMFGHNTHIPAVKHGGGRVMVLASFAATVLHGLPVPLKEFNLVTKAIPHGLITLIKNHSYELQKPKLLLNGKKNNVITNIVNKYSVSKKNLSTGKSLLPILHSGY